METKILKAVFFASFFLFVIFIFVNINWGEPFYFHPDERNIASSISQLNFPKNLNPHFFAYGSLPIYLAFVLGSIPQIASNGLNNLIVDFSTAIILTRLASALFALLLIFLIFKTTELLAGKREAFLAGSLASLSVAYIQFANFGTFEMWLSFFSLLIIYLLLLFVKSGKDNFIVYSSIAFGILCSLKLSFIGLIPIFILALLFGFKPKDKIAKKIFIFLLFILVSTMSYLVSSPFNLLDSQGFISSMNYEGSVALGTLPVFYTGTFFNTIPILYQYEKVLPFLINPLLTLISIPSLIYLSYLSITKRNKLLGLVVFSFLIIFVSQSALFVKWTRYAVPSLSFLYILIAIFIFKIKDIINGKIFNLIILFVLGVSFIYSISYAKTVKLSQDTRIEALNFSTKTIDKNSKILSEVYDLGIVPFNSYYPHITLFNFYDLDNVDTSKKALSEELNNSDYIIIPSQRIMQSRILDNSNFPNGNNFYKSLFADKLNYRKIYQTPCDIFCKITYMGDPVFNLEQTASVFDRPTVFIFENKKITNKNNK
ncbi:MAG TPA: glycosyltransferase family 39 protein [Patescibacteria group bacterium]|nr:glycosyltransferase family 39 protein [Patescibacteria group bacterium]